MTPGRYTAIRAVAESDPQLHHSPTLVLLMLRECLCEIQRLQAEIAELKTPRVVTERE